MNRSLVVASLALLTQIACQVGEKKESVAKDLTYSFQDNGCATGKVRYVDDADFCKALQDDARNNNCALDLRRRAFRAKPCPGEFDNGSEGSTTTTTLSGGGGSGSTSSTTTTTTRPVAEDARDIEIRAQIVGSLWNRQSANGQITLRADLRNLSTDQRSSPLIATDYLLGEARTKTILLPGPGICVPSSIDGKIARSGQTGSTLQIELPTSNADTRFACDSLASQTEIVSEVRIRFDNVPTSSGANVGRVIVRVGPAVPRR